MSNDGLDGLGWIFGGVAVFFAAVAGGIALAADDERRNARADLQNERYGRQQDNLNHQGIEAALLEKLNNSYDAQINACSQQFAYSSENNLNNQIRNNN